MTPNKPVTCTHAASPAYTVGREYTPYKNAKGHTCLRGDDGLEDLASLLVSTFVPSGTANVVRLVSK